MIKIIGVIIVAKADFLAFFLNIHLHDMIFTGKHNTSLALYSQKIF